MINLREQIDKILNSSNTEHIFLESDKGELLEFEQVAFIPVENRAFAILAPVKGNPYFFIDNPVAFTFEMDLKENTIEVVRDMATVEMAEKEYHKILYGNKKKGF